MPWFVCPPTRADAGVRYCEAVALSSVGDTSYRRKVCGFDEVRASVSLLAGLGKGGYEALRAWDCEVSYTKGVLKGPVDLCKSPYPRRTWSLARRHCHDRGRSLHRGEGAKSLHSHPSMACGLELGIIRTLCLRLSRMVFRGLSSIVFVSQRFQRFEMSFGCSNEQFSERAIFAKLSFWRGNLDASAERLMDRPKDKS